MLGEVSSPAGQTPRPAGLTTIRRRRSTLVPWLQLSPAGAFFGAFFLAPIAILALYSFYTYTFYSFNHTFTATNYSDTIHSSVYRSFFVRTITTAAAVALIVTAISFPLCYIFIFVFRRATQVLYFLVLVSFFGGYLVRIYAWRTL